MIGKEFNSIIDLIKAFPTEQSCINHLELLRWNGNVVSPFDSTSKVYKCKGNNFRCKNTGRYFNVRTGTLFDNTKIELIKWFMAIWLITSHKKGISSIQLSKDINVTQKTAWFMNHRIRKCFGIKNDSELNNEVEMDETFVGGKNKNRHRDKKVKNSQGRSFKDKTPVFGMLERKGNLVATVVNDTSSRSIQPIIHKHVPLGATIHTDEWLAYEGLDRYYNRCYVEHWRGQYVNGDSYTNTIEGAWSILKRMIIGIYHVISKNHLQRYVNEFVFRYNTRHNNEYQRFNLFLQNIEYRLTYKELIYG